ncbi:activating signal cointegrator 1 complex subunit 2 [Ptiloglossa arizonensis]|uniref:activating signal cointegrator 1 complex subunit 2 n=1 Tax=Ptiloglossa arizonensis TaxID=3350558 RepID=UPI003F9F73DF
MTENVSCENMEPFENPDLLPLEKVKLNVKIDGVIESIDALNKRWVDDHYFLNYEAPKLYNEDGSEIMGAKEHWMTVVKYMIDDIKWLLSLPYYRFWSNIVFNTSIVNALVSFLQEAPPFYALESFPNCPDMLELLETLRRYVLVIFARLITNKESPGEYISRPFLGNLLYENYIFTIPIIFDLCQLYGRENEKIMEKILNCLFILEPRYNNDLQKAVPCLIEALENVERKFNGYFIHNPNEAVSLTKQNTGSIELTLFNLEDMILYVLDISSTINVFLKNYPPAVSTFHREDFMNKIVSIYEGTIPEMYNKLDKLGYNEANLLKYTELKYRLDVTRIEMLHLFRIIIYEPVRNIQENLSQTTEAEIKECVEEYLTFLTSAISEKEFITDYDQFYPVKSDLKILSNICPEVDTIKCNYILKSISANVEKPSAPYTALSNNIADAVAGPSGVVYQSEAVNDNISSLNGDNSFEMISLISEVKDILYDLDESFIEICLKHYNYDTASVINAVLENTLPPRLKNLKDQKPAIDDTLPDCTMPINEDLALGIEELNMFSDDDDEVHVMTREIIEVPKDYITRNYSLITDDYDDEHDDTYDDINIRGTTQLDSIEIDGRPFGIPRVLREKQKIETADESESEAEDVEADQNGKDHFIRNPAELRAKAEQRRQANRGGKCSTNMTGKSKGQGQEKDTSHNRQQKRTRTNHNARSGAQWKRSQGMIPS